jgi:hypothetical protein
VTLECLKVALQSPERRLGYLGGMTQLPQFPDDLTLAFNEGLGFRNVALSLPQVL